MTLPPLSKWSSQSGFTFYTWIRVEKLPDLKTEFYKPVILWLVTTHVFIFDLSCDIMHT